MKVYRSYGIHIEEVENFPLVKELLVRKISKSNFSNTLGDSLPDKLLEVYVSPEGERFTIDHDGDAISFPYSDEELGRWNSYNTAKYEIIKRY